MTETPDQAGRPDQPGQPESGTDRAGRPSQPETGSAPSGAGTETAGASQDGLARAQTDRADVSSPAKVMRIGTMVKQLLEEVRTTELDEKGRQRLAEIHRRSIDELEDGLSKDLIDELERLDLPFDSSDGPPSTSELRIAQAQLVGWLEGLFHGIQTAIMAQQAMAQQQMAGRSQLPVGLVPTETPTAESTADQSSSDEDKPGTGNYL